MTADLVAFIRARLGEDNAHVERLFKLGNALSAKHQRPWSEQEHENNAVLELGAYARQLLLSIDAKRRILGEHVPTPSGSPPPITYLCCTCVLAGNIAKQYPDDWYPQQHPCTTLRAVASEWPNHPDYQTEWRP